MSWSTFLIFQIVVIESDSLHSILQMIIYTYILDLSLKNNFLAMPPKKLPFAEKLLGFFNQKNTGLNNSSIEKLYPTIKNLLVNINQ